MYQGCACCHEPMLIPGACVHTEEDHCCITTCYACALVIQRAACPRCAHPFDQVRWVLRGPRTTRLPVFEGFAERRLPVFERIARHAQSA